MPDPQTNLGGAPVTLGPVGFWLDKDGNVAATDPQGNRQVTPGQRDNPQSAIYYDAAKDLDYNLVNGHKVYQSPVAFDGTKTVYKQSKNGPPISDTGGGAFHGHPQWNPQDGKWDVNLDMGKILSWAAAAGISAGVITAAMGPTAAGAGGLVGSGEATVASTGGAFGGAATGAVGGAAGAGVGTGVVKTATAGRSVLNWLVPAVDVAGQLFGAKLQSDASVEAEKLRQKSIAEALAFEKQRYGDLQGRLAPYVAAGSTSADRMSQLLGLPARPDTTAANWSRSPGPSGSSFQPPAGPSRVTTQPVAPPMRGPGGPEMPPADPAAGQTVLMRSPDGRETQPVPLADVPHWKSLGAVPVGNA